MAIIHVDETYPGLPNSGRLSGTNGDLVGIMDIALVANGWSIEYSSGNARVYRPGTGNRFRLHMYDDSSASGQGYLCVVRGCENASSATSLTDPFPTVALVADNASNWIKSNANSTAARSFDIWVGTTWVIYAVNVTGATNIWDFACFGDAAPALAGDSYNTVCAVRQNTTNQATIMISSPSSGYTGTSKFWWARSYDGTVKSTNCAPALNTTSFGISKGPQAFLGQTGGLDTQKVPLLDCGGSSGTPSATLGMFTRGWFPNLLNPLHGGRNTANTRDTYTNTAYDPSFIGSIVCNANAATSAFFVVESSDTWSPPSG
jgi:hypothetical protein